MNSSIVVSIIIPVFNDSIRLRECLLALKNQTYPSDLYEVIVVDNNSTDNLAQRIEDLDYVKLEKEVILGSYAARNKGISVAKGQILAFTDSDCVPSREWLENGVLSLKAENADLVGGKITFSFSPQRSSAEIFDSITALQVKKNIELRKVTVTANLFAYRYVFNSIGVFDDSLKSGGDFKWTGKATDAGFKLAYAAGAEILHPARDLNSLIKKGYRVGTGQFCLQQQQNVFMSSMIVSSFRNLLPPSPWGYWKFICTSGCEEARRQFLSIWAIAWICNIANSLGRFKSLQKEWFKVGISS